MAKKKTERKPSNIREAIGLARFLKSERADFLFGSVRQNQIQYRLFRIPAERHEPAAEIRNAVRGKPFGRYLFQMKFTHQIFHKCAGIPHGVV